MGQARAVGKDAGGFCIFATYADGLQELKDLKDNYNQLHAAVIGKLTEYDQNVVNVSSDLKAMEKVFQKVLPTFTDNINELNRVVKSMKKK